MHFPTLHRHVLAYDALDPPVRDPTSLGAPSTARSDAGRESPSNLHLAAPRAFACARPEAMRAIVAVLSCLATVGCAGVPRSPGEASVECDEWPVDEGNPRVGFYLHDRSVDQDASVHDQQLYRFDGDTITMYFNPSYAFRPDCSYGHLDDVAVSIRPFLAHVDDGGCLYALQPCYGWTYLGRFEGDELLTRYTVMRRVPAGDRRRLILPPLWSAQDVDVFFACQPLWVDPDEPMPPRPNGCQRQ